MKSIPYVEQPPDLLEAPHRQRYRKQKSPRKHVVSVCDDDDDDIDGDRETEMDQPPVRKSARIKSKCRNEGNEINEAVVTEHIDQTQKQHQYACTMCSMTTNFPSNLIRHKKAAHGVTLANNKVIVRKFVCETCGYKCQTAFNLQVHHKRLHKTSARQIIKRIFFLK